MCAHQTASHTRKASLLARHIFIFFPLITPACLLLIPPLPISPNKKKDYFSSTMIRLRELRVHSEGMEAEKKEEKKYYTSIT